MFPIFLWIKQYNGLNDLNIKLDPNYDVKIEFKDQKIKKVRNVPNDKFAFISEIEHYLDQANVIYSLNIKKNNSSLPSNFYSDNIESINVIVGKNGTGKSSILKLLSMERDELYKNYKKKEHLIIYKTNKKTKEGKEVFLLEGLYPEIDKEYFYFLKNKPDNHISRDYSFLIDESNLFYDFCSQELLQKSIYGRFKLNIPQNRYKNYKSRGLRIQRTSKEYKDISYSKLYDFTKYLKKINFENFEKIKMKIIVKNCYKENIPLEIIKDRSKNKLNENLIEKYCRFYPKDTSITTRESILRNYCDSPYSYLLEEEIKKVDNLTESILEEINLKLKNELKKDSAEESIKLIFNKMKNYYDLELKNDEMIIIKAANAIEKIKQFDPKYGLTINEFKDKDIYDLLIIFDDVLNDDYDIYKFKELKKILSVEIRDISDGEKSYLNLFSSIFSFLDYCTTNNIHNVILLIDEIETYLHPEWARRVLFELIKLLKEDSNKKFKLIFSTHSPFLLSDLHKDYCIALEKKDLEVKIKPLTENIFGSNIHSLLKNELFLDNTIGEISKQKITSIIDTLSNKSIELTENKRSEIERIINIIGDPIIKKILENKLIEMTKNYNKNNLDTLKNLYSQLSLAEKKEFERGLK